jgi:hypothetical protein
VKFSKGKARFKVSADGKGIVSRAGTALLRELAADTVKRLVEDGVGSPLDEFASFDERPMHLRRHRSYCFGDEAGDEARRLAGAAGAGWSCGGAGEAFVEDGGDVDGAAEAARLDEARQQGLNVVVVGFGAGRRVLLRFPGGCGRRVVLGVRGRPFPGDVPSGRVEPGRGLVGDEQVLVERPRPSSRAVVEPGAQADLDGSGQWEGSQRVRSRSWRGC